MKRLFSKLGIGAAGIAGSYLFGYAERGYFANGAELMITMAIIAWMVYEVYLVAKRLDIERSKRQRMQGIIHDQKAFIEDLAITLKAANDDCIRLEQEKAILVNGLKELGAIKSRAV
ncbi:MAG: hypothetical protein Q4D77_02380 [Peptostreptococcaceae bacterium]|nr:hypothetical protein [Peptostreptococcaceae bacterium]